MSIKFGKDFQEVGTNHQDYYVNPNILGCMSDRLHVCESLFGDFDAELMVLLQDAADENSFKKLKEKNPSINPLIHNPSANTNKKLVFFLESFFPKINISGTEASSCGIYYANAVWLVKKGDGMRAPIKKKSLVLKECSEVLDATVNNLKNLRLIMTFGQIAYEAIASKFKINLSWHEALKQDGLITVEGYFVGAFPHPAARGIDKNKIKEKISHLLLESNFVKV